MDDIPHSTGERTVGIKQTVKAVQKNRVKHVCIAKDADRRIVDELTELCRKKGISVIYAESMEQLGKECGIDVGASAAGFIESSELD